ncbi:hypothetical protein SPRG_05665 [Saprolegnia parasitica CBS 223.65]|uniref:Uncharacterized protein n=1 Tax=Saprolegnia parasitica (strain CBS 223.65) TaxID=695850 RepID=A0A067CKL1_SAPPC|nr:hypothetical protein SPRG_05665 [Saprolegnia parasitica CBS 223.65]KDO29715.1 hypothetical protein SPRG_05665 [Saprolegnia parasitica CBS 223.65]|eukprot:XP_012199770.1 hypothetical protein SPRG_05665 [Saprolegnia parasitica CBS 223.65]
MATAKVVSGPVPPGPGKGDVRQGPRTVRRNAFILSVSLLFLLNVLCMPMKAYLSEDVPWGPLIERPIFPNYSSFNATILDKYQTEYAFTRLPNTSTYFSDASSDVQVVRLALDLNAHVAVAVEDCVGSFLRGMPGVVYFTSSVRNLLCELGATASVRPAQWHNRGLCVYDMYFTINLGHQCVWLEFDPAQPNTLVVVSALAMYTTYMWRWFKFIFRILVTLRILHVVWTDYYLHCYALEHVLATRGHLATMPDGDWSYEVLWGDPTAFVLLHPGIALTFVIDYWLSVDVVTVVIVRASQNDDIIVMLTAFLYLSRTVWFAYAAMGLTSYVLKRWHKEHLFAEVDLTLVAIGATCYGPAASWASGNVTFLLETFQFFFEALVPVAEKGQEFEGCLSSLVYTLMLASMPIMYGFTRPLLRRRTSTIQLVPCTHSGTVDPARYSSFLYNGFKTRLVFTALHRWTRDYRAGIPSVGGSIYTLFDLDARYKQYPTTRFRGPDVFVHCYCNGKLVEILRLSLLVAFDRNVNTPNMAIATSDQPSPYTVYTIQLPTSETQKTPLLLCPSKPSAWCL